jgi:4-hydroxy-tetrahydrodipicolinate synthase
MNFEKFKGVFTALVTPFDREKDTVSESDLAQLIENQIENGVNGILLLGSTSEASTLSEQERLHILEFSLEVIRKRVPVMIGINFNDTRYAAELTEKFSEILKKFSYSESDASFLVNNPSYNKPTEDGMFAHFEAVHDAANPFPLFIYNIPSRSIFDLKNEFLKRLFINLERVIGLKDCSGDLNRVFELKEWVEMKSKCKKLHLFCGDDNLFLPHFINGGCGVISVCSNLLPEKMSEMWKFLESGNFSEAVKIHKQLMPFFKNLFVEPNPSPVKYLMSIKFGIENILRLPLLSVSEKNSIMLKQMLDDLNKILD